MFLVLDGSETSRDHAATIQEKISKEKVKDSKLLTLDSDKIQKSIESATGLWLVGQDPESLKDCKFLDSIKSLINRRAVLGAGGRLIEGFGIPGSGLFPGSEIRHSSAKEVKQKRKENHY